MYTLKTNDIVAIRDALINGVSVEALAEEYGISEAMVIAIRDGEDPFANQIALDERAVLRSRKRVRRRRKQPSETGFEQRLAQLESALADQDELLRIQRLQQERMDELEKRLSLLLNEAASPEQRWSEIKREIATYQQAVDALLAVLANDRQVARDQTQQALLWLREVRLMYHQLTQQPKTGQPNTEQPKTDQCNPSLTSPLVSPASIPEPTFLESHRGKILWLGGVVATLGFNWVVFPQQVQAHWFNWVILSLVGWPLLLIWSVLHWLHLT
jgi:hypothetical protein